MTADVTNLSQDSEHLKAIQKRYAEEARKRLRPDGSAQFVQLTETDIKRFNALVEDPWADHEALNAQDPPIKQHDTHKFFVLGAGFGGLQFAVRLIEKGLATADDIRLVDAAGGFGGTWYWNRFPGLHCDVESYIYLPLLEETGYIPSHKYAPGQEIRQHAERIASKWKLEDKTLFRSDVKSVEWDDKAQLWTIKLTQRRGPSAPNIDIEFRAEFVYLAAGVLTKPQIPDIPGLLSFSGSIFHTARWNYKVSGGSQANQTLTGLEGKKVGVVGTAATAIGTIPQVAKYAGELFVFQRTPAVVNPRGQHPTDVAQFKDGVATEDGWQFKRQLNFGTFLNNAALPGTPNLVGDAWTTMPGYSAVVGSPNYGIVDPAPENLAQHTENFHKLDLPHMEDVRSRVDAIVKDPDTAEKLKPWYPSWCKRPTFSDAYLQAFNQPNVHLVDTDGQGVSKATEKGLVVGGKEYPLDIIIFGTGYKTPASGLGSPSTRTGVAITGREELSLDDKWQTNGPATLHGYATSGFPNLFFSSSNQATITGNNVFMLGLIADHITYMIAEAKERVKPGQRPIIEVTRQAEQAHTEEILKRAPYYSALAGCTPGYFNGHGEASRITDPKEKAKRAKASAWGEGTQSFLDYIEGWRNEGSLHGLEIRPAVALNGSVGRLSKL
ncbi:hypothetical protein NM208_g1900 [Fusarium decemcellulare]|uniref:Uncharacterized protein n=1 Tax=Fusarium decemcellulare TaxID=57161 RepID=A0ACC1SUJ6_9HYPO|nr:hypothetical protein NM208_g1900 [Fusarium decemcellulare]